MEASRTAIFPGNLISMEISGSTSGSPPRWLRSNLDSLQQVVTRRPEANLRPGPAAAVPTRGILRMRRRGVGAAQPGESRRRALRLGRRSCPSQCEAKWRQGRHPGDIRRCRRHYGVPEPGPTQAVTPLRRHGTPHQRHPPCWSMNYRQTDGCHALPRCALRQDALQRAAVHVEAAGGLRHVAAA
jgi:hypothetical protein